MATRQEPGEHASGPGHRPEITEIVAEIVTGLPGVRPGRMFGFPAFYAGDKLFACVYGEGLSLKLPLATVEAIVGGPGITRFEPYGRKMREWALIVRAEAADYRDESDLILAAARYVGELATH